jgi:SOUL heme-binding protein
MYYYIFGALVGGVALWAIGSYLVIARIEEPAYTVVEKKDGYEIRQYQPYIMAKTTVTGNYAEATNKGFRIIADYIFGNNTKKESIAMTTPVLESEAGSEKIAMTTPVLESAGENNERTIAFVLPSKYTMDTLPAPNNNAVTFMEVPARKVAALRFSWYANESRMETKKELLKSYLKRDSVIASGAAETARYNPPLSMPLLLRNEVLIPIE